MVHSTKHVEDQVRRWVVQHYGGREGCSDSELELQAVQDSIRFVDQQGDEPLRCVGCGCIV